MQLNEPSKHIALNALAIAERHHGADLGERLNDLVEAVKAGSLRPIGQYSLIGAEVNVASIRPLMDSAGWATKNVASLVLGKDSWVSADSIVSHSAIIGSGIREYSEVADGSIIVSSELHKTRVRDTRLAMANLNSVHGSSGGNEITGDISYATIAASNSQVFVTPNPKS